MMSTGGRTPPNVLPVRVLPPARLVTQPPFVPQRLWPQALLERFGEGVLWPVVEAVLRRVDLTPFVLDHVSVARIIQAVDVKAVLAEIDVSGVADQVVRDLDLPMMIRTSSEALGTDAVVGLRLQSASADDVVDRLVGRLVRRRPTDGHGRRPTVP
jgi:hypothetical protein